MRASIRERFLDASRPETIVLPDANRPEIKSGCMEMRIFGRESSGNRSEIVKMHYFLTLAHFRTAIIGNAIFELLAPL
uniref:Uncharacterized protein n=1 Tax=Acrobeloides nanus TaxID=290746 RepID=A0A914DMR8_9BILA